MPIYIYDFCITVHHNYNDGSLCVVVHGTLNRTVHMVKSSAQKAIIHIHRRPVSSCL